MPRCDDVDLRFWTTLIKVRNPTAAGLAELKANCTHVHGPFWIMEGDVEYLREAGVRLTEVATGSVPSLGGLGEVKLRRICHDSFGVEV